MKKRILSLMMTLSLSAALLAGCGNSGSVASTAASTAVSAEVTTEDTAESASTAQAQSQGVPTKDRSGNAITVPAQVSSIISMAPSTTQLLIDLGLADKIVACDTNSAAQFADSLTKDIPQFDMMTPDQEKIVALKPDLVFTSGMSSSSGTDVFQSVRDAGICVADIPSSSSIEGIQEDIQFVGSCVGESDAASAIVTDMQKTVDEVKAIGSSIPENEKKTVLYEMSTPTADSPTIYSCGKDTYIDEILTDIGAVNAAGEQTDQWPALTEEAAVAMKPDVIITSDNYTEDVVNVLLKLSGWENVPAVQNKAVYTVDANLISQPNQHVTEAMIDMAKKIYPDQYADVQAAEADSASSAASN